MVVSQGHRGHDQRPDRGDRPAALRSSSTRSCTTRSSRSSRAPGAGCTTWSTRARRARAQDPRPERLEEGPAEGPGARGRVRPEGAVQEGLRGGVRHLRRRAVRRPDRRLRVRQPPAGHGAAREDLARRGRGPRAVHLGGLVRAVRLGQLHRAGRGRATWPRSSNRTEYVKWRSFRDSEDSRYVGLTLPHILMRLPYGKDTARPRRSTSRRTSTARDHKKYLWGNAAYAFGTRLTDAFAKYHWTRRDPRRRRRRPGRRACRRTPSRPTRATSR